MNAFLQDHGVALRAFADLPNRINAHPDYVQGGGGNATVKLDGGLMAKSETDEFRLAFTRTTAAASRMQFGVQARPSYPRMTPRKPSSPAGGARNTAIPSPVKKPPDLETGFDDVCGLVAAQNIFLEFQRILY